MTEDLQEAFLENNYNLKIDHYTVLITKKYPYLYPILFILMLLVVPFVVLLAGYKILLLVILLLFAPFIYTKWKFPNTIVISTLDKCIGIKRQQIPFRDIKEIKTTSNVQTSDVSPFKEGYQDFIYSYEIITTKNEILRLFELKFREPVDDLAAELNNYLNSIIKN